MKWFKTIAILISVFLFMGQVCLSFEPGNNRLPEEVRQLAEDYIREEYGEDSGVTYRWDAFHWDRWDIFKNEEYNDKDPSLNEFIHSMPSTVYIYIYDISGRLIDALDINPKNYDDFRNGEFKYHISYFRKEDLKDSYDDDNLQGYVSFPVEYATLEKIIPDNLRDIQPYYLGDYWVVTNDEDTLVYSRWLLLYGEDRLELMGSLEETKAALENIYARTERYKNWHDYYFGDWMMLALGLDNTFLMEIAAEELGVPFDRFIYTPEIFVRAQRIKYEAAQVLQQFEPDLPYEYPPTGGGGLNILPEVDPPVNPPTADRPLALPILIGVLSAVSLLAVSLCVHIFRKKRASA